VKSLRNILRVTVLGGFLFLAGPSTEPVLAYCPFNDACDDCYWLGPHWWCDDCEIWDNNLNCCKAICRGYNPDTGQEATLTAYWNWCGCNPEA
jgi:hypothetical protein